MSAMFENGFVYTPLPADEYMAAKHHVMEIFVLERIEASAALHPATIQQVVGLDIICIPVCV